MAPHRLLELARSERSSSPRSSSVAAPLTPPGREASGFLATRGTRSSLSHARTNEPARATTIAFGRFAGGERIVGRYHAPVGEPRGGVVLCGPGGVEDIWTYATYRALAERLALQGFPVLRFDYHGQGDSSGSDRDPARVEAWLDSVRFAIDELAQRSGVATRSLFGLRLGATLATLVASERGDLENLVLWAPLAGRAYLREQRAYRRFNPPAPAPQGEELPAGTEEAAGFEMTAETIAALGELDPTKVRRRPARSVLLLARGQASSEDKLARALGALGVATTEAGAEGFAAMMIEPRRSVIPEATLEDVTRWLTAKSPVLDEPGAPSSRRRGADASGGTAELLTRSFASGALVQEHALRFGDRDDLFGVVTEPLDRGPREETAILFLTVASHHRVGANRMHVTLAREAAAQGFTAMRLDVRGIGESASKTGAPHHYDLAPVVDVQAAMTALAARGVRRFVLAGLCSGAFLAYHTALRDPRVEGLVLANPQALYLDEEEARASGERATLKSTRAYLELLKQPETWRRALGGEVALGVVGEALLGRARRFLAARLARLGERAGDEATARPSVRRDLDALLGRRARACFIFSEADEGKDHLEAHLGRDAASMRGVEGFELVIVKGPDHTFAPLWSQARLCALVTSRLVSGFGASSRGAATRTLTSAPPKE